MPARLVHGAFLTYLRDGRSVCCPLVTLVIVDVDLEVIGVLLVVEIVSIVIVVGV